MITDTSLVLNSNKVQSNIQKMARKAEILNVEFRPHFKTHQSHIIGSWFREQGVKGITVSSIKMAEYFAKAGWESITIAFPANILEINKLSELSSKIDLRVLATNIEVLKLLDSQLTHEVGIYIELDPGYHRSGIPILDFDSIRKTKQVIISAKNLRFEGFYTHAGHSYKCRSKKEISKLSSAILNDLQLLKSEFNDPICFGDTPSCSVLDNFGVIDQISAGNFVFYDWTQFNIGSCDINEIAIAMYCPVVAKYPERNELLIHGGAVHFSKDSFQEINGVPYYGIVAEKLNKGWGNPIEGNILKSISQEHGIVSCTTSFFEKMAVGDLIPILPIHSCLSADVMGEYFTLDEKHIDHMNQKVFR
mgnify:CR=1 FL=1|tara:strand:- start:2652 stop:3740 length:1089 start_codon:yes stop_codon:yes gene_type:complete